MILTPAEIARATGGLLIHDGPAGPIRTDSRALTPGDWFLALRGDRFDGHEFLPKARELGCAGVIAEQVPARSFHGYLLQLAQPIRTRASVSGPDQESDLLAFEVHPDGRWTQLEDEDPGRTDLTAAFPAGLVLVIGGTSSISIVGAGP